MALSLDVTHRQGALTLEAKLAAASGVLERCQPYSSSITEMEDSKNSVSEYSVESDARSCASRRKRCTSLSVACAGT